jgi:hypothetical protein
MRHRYNNANFHHYASALEISMTPNIVCTCCGCWTCYTDGFNRPDGDVVTDAPLAWIPPSLYYIVSHRLVLAEPVNVLQFNHEIDFIKATEYIVKCEIVADGITGELALFASMVDESNCYVGVYDAAVGEIRLYFVQGPTYPTDWVLLNSQLTELLPKWLQLTVNQVDFLIEVAVIEDVTFAKTTCVAPYNINGGTRCGIGRINGGDNPPLADIIVDNFSLCENKCLKGCLIGYDVFDRPTLPTLTLGENWIEHETLPADIQIIADPGYGTGGGICLFTASKKMFWAHPHPDGHTTMGVAFRVFPFSLYEVGGVNNVGLANASAKWVKLYACVDDPNTPTEWVSAEIQCNTGAIAIKKAVGGVEGAALTTTGPGLPTGSLANSLFDFYLCVDEFGKVTLYGKNPTFYEWVALKSVYISGLSGTYCGIECYGNPTVPTPGVDDQFQTTFVDQFAFLKTKHDGDPNIVEWTVGGTIEIGDKFIIGVTNDIGSEQTTVVAASTDTHLVAKQLFDTIVGLDPLTHPILRTISWVGDWDNNKIRAQDQSLFTGIAITTETDDTAADGQTFEVVTLQEWVKGAYNCPPCPPWCPPCSYCSGDPPATPPQTDTPDVVRVIISGCQRTSPPGEVDTVDCNGYNAFQIPANDKPQPFPNFPGAFDCTDSFDYMLGYDGDYLLHGCDCSWIFTFPTWVDWYYPDGGPLSTVDNDHLINSCYPGNACNGFVVRGGINQDLGADITGHTLFWTVNLESIGSPEDDPLSTHWKSENFPYTECKQPRTLQRYYPTGPPIPEDGNLGFPEFIQLIPEGTKLLL